MAASTEPTIARLEDQIAWYDKKSSTNQRWFKFLKVVAIVAAAIIPFAVGFELTRIWLAGSLGVLIVVVEGLQQLNQYQHNWMAYRSTAEALKHEKYLHLAQAGPYLGADKPTVLLAERVESLVSQEHAKWVSAREQAARGGPRSDQS